MNRVGWFEEWEESEQQMLASGGVPPNFGIIDGGWQSVGQDQKKAEDKGDADKKPSPLMRFTGIRENSKFQTAGGNGKAGDPATASGIENTVLTAKDNYGLHYFSEKRYPEVFPGVVDNEAGMKRDPLTVQGSWLMNPKKESTGVDGVKVDVECVLETLGAGHGGVGAAGTPSASSGASAGVEATEEQEGARLTMNDGNQLSQLPAGGSQQSGPDGAKARKLQLAIILALLSATLVIFYVTITRLHSGPVAARVLSRVAILFDCGALAVALLYIFLTVRTEDTVVAATRSLYLLPRFVYIGWILWGISFSVTLAAYLI